MSSFDASKPVGVDYEDQAMIVCGGMILAIKGNGVDRDVSEIGGYLADTTLERSPGDGLWVWRGTIKWDGNEEPRYIGEWARPTDEEALRMAKGETPWLDGQWVKE